MIVEYREGERDRRDGSVLRAAALGELHDPARVAILLTQLRGSRLPSGETEPEQPCERELIACKCPAAHAAFIGRERLSSTTFWRRMPTPEMSTSTVSPSLIQSGGCL